MAKFGVTVSNGLTDGSPMKLKSVILSLLLLSALFLPNRVSGQMYRFSGGPSGGTFGYYASAISTLAKKAGFRVLAASSGGAIENIRTVNSGKSSFGITYSGHAFAARQGGLRNDERKYKNVLAVAYLYGAPAQLVVRADSEINNPFDLVEKRVGVGNAGSGAAANAELYFSQLGLWDKIDHEFLGYRSAADAFKNGQLDAFWVFVGYPNASVLEAALQNDIRLLDTYEAGEQAGMFERFPYFDKAVIPPGTYEGQSDSVLTFQDAAIWVACRDVPEEVVYEMLKAVFSEEGLDYLAEVHQSARALSIAIGLKGIVTPLHPGAEKYWREMGLLSEESSSSGSDSSSTGATK